MSSAVPGTRGAHTHRNKASTNVRPRTRVERRVVLEDLMEKRLVTFEANRRIATRLWHRISPVNSGALRQLTAEHQFSIALGDLLLLEGRWYVSHTGLLGLARRRHCAGITVQPVLAFCNPSGQRWAFEATVFKSGSCRGFVGYGDADPSNVSPLVHGAEMRIAETRAVNRALRKAYGIGICSVEELGAAADSRISMLQPKKPPQPVDGHRSGSKVRDRLCQLIRQHQLDPNLVKAYAIDFCGTKTLREATREQVESFVGHLGDWAEKDRTALLCQLNTYLPAKGGAA